MMSTTAAPKSNWHLAASEMCRWRIRFNIGIGYRRGGHCIARRTRVSAWADVHCDSSSIGFPLR
jgi:hypothetical protein